MKRLLPSLAIMFLLPWFWVTLAPVAAGVDSQEAVVSPKAAAVPGNGYVGTEVCATCHADIASKFSTNPHAQLALMHGGKGVTCESCHGPGEAHVAAGGDVSKIRQLDKMSGKKLDATCLGCHESVHPNFERSPHGLAGVSCISCHSVHKATVEAKLLRASEPMLCYQCHSDVKGTFAMPFHHPVKEGTVTCSDCHDVHGSFKQNNLKSTADQNLICTKCHVETRGPFVFEHVAVKAEGCVGCHTPHGSQNARLLNMPNINVLCNQCHSPVAAGTFHSLGAGSSQLTSCTNCHTIIHGSNLNQAFLK